MIRIDDIRQIQHLIKTARHIGTTFLDGIGCSVKSKTFNLYQSPNGKLLVTNHYGNELINAMVYENENELAKDYPDGTKTFHQYSIPLAP